MKDKARRILFGIGAKKDDESSDSSDSVNSEMSDDSTAGAKGLEYVDHNNVNYHDYEYCANKTQDLVANEEDS